MRLFFDLRGQTPSIDDSNLNLHSRDGSRETRGSGRFDYLIVVVDCFVELFCLAVCDFLCQAIWFRFFFDK